jgi:hypothetical protein
MEGQDSFSNFPLDLLAYCLGYVSLSDIRSCWLVCKRFKDAITTKKHFWRKVVERYLLQQGVLKKYVHHVDPFYTIQKESLREQVVFLFRGSLWFKLSEDNESVFISLRRRTITILEFNILKQTNIIESITMYQSRIGIFDPKYGKSISHFEDTVLRCIKGIPYYIERAKVALHEAIWTGYVMYEDNLILPHGKGKWTFSNGEVLEGDHVALNGNPVYILSFAEWREWKRQKI